MNPEEIILLLREAGMNDDWVISPVIPEYPSKQIWRLEGANHDLYVKMTRENERKTLQTITPLGLTHIQRSKHPKLLDKGVVVTDYCPHGWIKTKELDPGLIRDYAVLQNTLNKPPHIDKLPTDAEGFYRKSSRYFIENGFKCLHEHGKHVNKETYQGCAEIGSVIHDAMDTLVEEYCEMPFAWLHYDFREDNILAGEHMVLVDWGSSYGRGPFMHDIAPFLMNFERNKASFTDSSDICKVSTPEQVQRWITIASCLRFINRFQWFKDENPEGWKETTYRYQYETYKSLLDRYAL